MNKKTTEISHSALRRSETKMKLSYCVYRTQASCTNFPILHSLSLLEKSCNSLQKFEFAKVLEWVQLLRELVHCCPARRYTDVCFVNITLSVSFINIVIIKIKYTVITIRCLLYAIYGVANCYAQILCLSVCLSVCLSTSVRVSRCMCACVVVWLSVCCLCPCLSARVYIRMQLINDYEVHANHNINR